MTISFNKFPLVNRRMNMLKKYVYFFGGGKAEGKAQMRNLLGGKGANLVEMAGHLDLRLPVPPGFTITTEVCTYYYANKRKYPAGLKEEVNAAMRKIESVMKKKFGGIFSFIGIIIS